MKDLIILGGGPAGVTAAITYKKNNPLKSVMIIEKEKELLKKLSISGNGKGNFTNRYLSSDSYNNSSFVEDVYPSKPLESILSFFDGLGVKYYFDSEGRYFPYSNSAKTISYALKREALSLDILISADTKVNTIEKKNDIFFLSTTKGEFECKALVVASGGKNYPSLGSDGSIFSELERMGQHFTKMVPSNTFIKVKEKDVTKKLSGLRFNATLYLVNNGEAEYYEKGELLFKDDALSGIVSFNVSNRIAYLFKTSKAINPIIIVDFSNAITSEEIEKTIKHSHDLKETLMGFYHEKLVDVLLKGIKTKDELIRRMTGYPFTVESLGDFTTAQMTAGGIDIKDVKSSLESSIIPNLFFCGDILDVDAMSGGYNLSFAFLSGMRVGESIQ